MRSWLVFLTAMVVWAAGPAVLAGITVTSDGPMVQINTAGLPGTHIREHCTLWQTGDPSAGVMVYVDSSSGKVMRRATTADGGLTWTAGVDTGLTAPVGAASTDERNPVVRDFDQDGTLTGFFGTLQGSSAPTTATSRLFRATSTDVGVSWSGESLLGFGGADPNLGHTGTNGFIEAFETSGGGLRAYLAMNNITGTPSSATRLIESADGGANWTDLGNILIDGKNNVIGANGPVFTFVDDDDSQTKMGWLMFGESAHRGCYLMVSTDEGLSWALHTTLFTDSTVRSGDANFLSDSKVRLFYYRNTGSVPSDRQLWYEDFTLSGMSGIEPNNLLGGGAPPIAEPGTVGLIGLGLAVLVRRRR